MNTLALLARALKDLKTMLRVSRTQFRTGLALLALAALIGGSQLAPASPEFSLSAFLVATALVAICRHYPIYLPQVEVNLAHVAGLGMLFIYGPRPAVWCLGLGLLVSAGVRAPRPTGGSGVRELWSRLVNDLAQQVVPLVTASSLFLWQGGRFPFTGLTGETAGPLAVFSLAYFALFNLFLAFDLDSGRGWVTSFSRAHFARLAALELLPLPVVLIAAGGYRLIGPGMLLLFGGLLVGVTASLHSLSRTQARLKEKIRENTRLHEETQRQTEELSRLLDISSRLSATLNTEDALSLICPSATRIVGAAGAALFIVDTRRAELALAYAEGLSPTFVQACGIVSIADPAGSRLLTSAQPQLVANLSQAAHSAPAGWDELMAAEGLRAYLSLALQARGEPLGALVAYFPQPPDLLPWMVELFRAFGSQAALTIANTRLYERTEEALAHRVQRLAALASISRELSATLDLQALFDTIIARAVDGTHARLGRLGITDAAGQSLRFVAGHGLPGEAPEAAGPVVECGIAMRVLRTGRAELMGDVRNDTDYVEISPATRSQLCVPIAREERRLGVILLESDRLNAFSDEDQEFVEQLAVQAAIAIDNARLYSEAHARLREQSILYEAGLALTSTLDRRAIYSTLAQKLIEVVGADECALLDYDLATDTLRTAYQWVPSDRASRVPPQSYKLESNVSSQRLMRERVPILVRTDDPQADPNAAGRLRTAGLGALLALPLTASDQVVGVAELYADQPRDFAEAEVRLAQTLASQAAIALENAHLFYRVTETRDRFVAVLNSTREGVLVIDASGLVSLVNPRLEEFWGIPAGRLLGQDLPRLLKSPDLNIADKLGFRPEEILEMLQTLRAGLALAIPKAQYRLASPKPRFIERSGAPVLDRFGKAIGWVITLRDVTEEREIQEVREALSSMIVHDLRSPLTAVLASTTLVRDQMPPQAKSPVVTQAIEVAMRSSKKLIGLVNTLLDIARMESGEITLQRTEVSLDALVDEIVAEFMPLAAEHGIILLNEASPLLPHLLVDREKVSRIFTNLIDNALKFAPAGGRIWIRGRPAPSGESPDGKPMLLCEVVDTGPGIPEDYRDKIFNRFVQIQGRTGRRQGTGLGLAFCKLTVEAHGGRIWAENRPEGGSAFHFTLPIGSGSPFYYSPQPPSTPSASEAHEKRTDQA